MANIGALITRIDLKLRSIHNESSLVAKASTTVIKQDPLLSEYLELSGTNGIINAIEYMALDGLAQHFNLYEDNRERQQLLAVMGDELNQSSDSEILASVQIIQYTYPSIYNISQEQITLTKKRAISKITGLNPPLQPDTSSIIDRFSEKLPYNVPNSSIQVNPPALNEFQTKLIMMAGSITIAVLFGALLANSFSKPSSLPIANQSTNQVNSPASTSTHVVSQSNSQPNISAQQTSTPVTNTSNITRELAVETVRKWLAYKRVIFAPPYNTQTASELLTGKAYRNNIDKSSETCNSSDGEGCLSSVDWLRKYSGEYSFGVQKVDSIDRFEASGDNASIFVTITEYRTLHQRGSSKPSGGINRARYDLKYENGIVKLEDYKII
jgi:ARC6-like, IMS domain